MHLNILVLHDGVGSGKDYELYLRVFRPWLLYILLMQHRAICPEMKTRMLCVQLHLVESIVEMLQQK